MYIYYKNPRCRIVTERSSWKPEPRFSFEPATFRVQLTAFHSFSKEMVVQFLQPNALPLS